MFKGISIAPTPHRKHQHYFTQKELTYSRRIPAYKSPRIIINVSGMRYETYEETLSNYPDTLLGSPIKRKPYYNSTNDEYCFYRDKYSFNAILFYYQSSGILSKPADISEATFTKELEFYGIELPCDDVSMTDEDSNKDKASTTEVDLPKDPTKRKLWLCFEYPRSSIIARVLALWSVMIIAVSTISFCIETLPPLQIIKERTVTEYTTSTHNVTTTVTNSSRTIVTLRNITIPVTRVHKLPGVTDYWFVIETFCVGWFTFEYLVRLYSAPSKRNFMKSPMGSLDIIAILPYYITLAVNESTFDVQSFSVLRALRLFRVLRIFKLSRYSKALGLLVKTLYASSEQLKTLCFCSFVGVVLFSSAIFYAENNKTTFPSIPHSFWWAIITMTSVGYGDVVPVTLLGKLIGSFCAMCGIILFCLPTPVLVSNFVKYYLDYGALDERKKQFAKNLKEIFLRSAKPL